MEISRKTWLKYIEALRKVSNKASDEARRFIETHDLTTGDGLKAFTDFAYALVTKYGEGATAVACEFYDALAVLSGMNLAPALPAATATYGETAKAINGVRLKSQNTEVLSSSIGRLVKMAGVDTTMQNAIRDGAQWAWIPHGDTCAFCLTLASRGWQPASKKALKNGHAEHIHANCDCTYAIRFNDRTFVEGYDPNDYLRMYRDADGTTSTQKINALRREFYAENKDRINAQKRSAYAKRVELNEPSAEELNVD